MLDKRIRFLIIKIHNRFWSIYRRYMLDKSICGIIIKVHNRILTLGWDMLQKRRDLARLSMMYRIVHHLVDIPVEPYLTPSTSMARGHDSRFFQIRTSNTTYQQSFFSRIVIL